jgi:choice-of-anchor A domain-containing protein
MLRLGSGAAAYGDTLLGSFQSNATPMCGIDHATPVDFPTVEANLKDYSEAFRDTPANGTVTFQWGALALVGTDPDLNVFNVTAAQLQGTSSFQLSAPEGSSVVVNVSGTDIVWQNAGFSMPDGGASCRNGTSTWCHRVLYNLYEAETLTLGGIGVQGSVLAPYATVEGTSGNIDGQLICEYLYGSLEYHPYFFTACIQLPEL